MVVGLDRAVEDVVILVWSLLTLVGFIGFAMPMAASGWRWVGKCLLDDKVALRSAPAR